MPHTSPGVLHANGEQHAVPSAQLSPIPWHDVLDSFASVFASTVLSAAASLPPPLPPVPPASRSSEVLVVVPPHAAISTHAKAHPTQETVSRNIPLVDMGSC